MLQDLSTVNKCCSSQPCVGRATISPGCGGTVWQQKSGQRTAGNEWAGPVLPVGEITKHPKVIRPHGRNRRWTAYTDLSKCKCFQTSTDIAYGDFKPVFIKWLRNSWLLWAVRIYFLWDAEDGRGFSDLKDWENYPWCLLICFTKIFGTLRIQTLSLPLPSRKKRENETKQNKKTFVQRGSENMATTKLSSEFLSRTVLSWYPSKKS